MTPDLRLVAAVTLLATGTLALRLAAVGLAARMNPTPRVQGLITMSVAVVFCALVTTAALFDGAQVTGAARPAGVLVAGVLAVRRAPFVLVVLAAAATAAGLRALGLS